MSLGAPPHFRRQNFPIAPGYHPVSLVVRRAPFTRATLQHFIYLERPEGTDIPQAPGFESPVAYERRPYRSRLTPTAEDFDTVSHLYRGIEDGMRSLSARLGEGALFIGDPSAQLSPELMDLPGLASVNDLESAVQAIETVIEQGEGGRNDALESHFARFSAMGTEYDDFLKHDRNFVPYRPVAADPVMFPPIGEVSACHIDAPDSAAVLDIANATYGLMLRLLSSATGNPGALAVRRAELDSAVNLMHVMHQLAVLLTTLAAGADTAVTAGMNFHLPRHGLSLPQREAGAVLMAERAYEIALALDALAGRVPGLSPALAERVRLIGDLLQQQP